MPVIPYSVLGYLSSSVVLAVYALCQGNAFTGYAGGTWAAFLGLALISTICGQFIFNLMLKWIPATMVSMSILGETGVTCFLAWLVLNEGITMRQGIGIVVIMCGLGLYFREQSKG